MILTKEIITMLETNDSISRTAVIRWLEAGGLMCKTTGEAIYEGCKNQTNVLSVRYEFKNNDVMVWEPNLLSDFDVMYKVPNMQRDYYSPVTIQRPLLFSAELLETMTIVSNQLLYSQLAKLREAIDQYCVEDDQLEETLDDLRLRVPSYAPELMRKVPTGLIGGPTFEADGTRKYRLFSDGDAGKFVTKQTNFVCNAAKSLVFNFGEQSMYQFDPDKAIVADELISTLTFATVWSGASDFGVITYHEGVNAFPKFTSLGSSDLKDTEKAISYTNLMATPEVKKSSFYQEK